MQFPKYTQEQIKELLDSGSKLSPASLYEPDHAPKGTRFIIWIGRGLYRVRS